MRHLQLKNTYLLHMKYMIQHQQRNTYPQDMTYTTQHLKLNMYQQYKKYNLLMQWPKHRYRQHMMYKLNYL